jgi:hypothetical protein
MVAADFSSVFSKFRGDLQRARSAWVRGMDLALLGADLCAGRGMTTIRRRQEDVCGR